MSKFIDSVRADLGYGRVAARIPKLSAEFHLPHTMEDYLVVRNLQEYVVSAKYEHRGNCHPQDLDRVTDCFLKGLRLHVYSDLYDKLIYLEHCIYEERLDAALEVIRDIYAETGIR